jgi:hypothetical protein
LSFGKAQVRTERLPRKWRDQESTLRTSLRLNAHAVALVSPPIAGVIIYDGDGNRVSKTVAGVTTSYLVDTQNPTGYAQVVYESFSGSSSANRELNHTYVYGLELISQVRSYTANFQGNTQKMYYVYDGHGSVRALTDPNAVWNGGCMP